MPDEEIAEILDLMLESIKLVQERFSRIRIPEDFVSTPEGITLLDAISMRLQVIGESVKRIQKRNPGFLSTYRDLDWDKIARFRDLVSHHYEHVDHEIIFDICRNYISILEEVVEQLR